jgi:hypothetical protein
VQYINGHGPPEARAIVATHVRYVFVRFLQFALCTTDLPFSASTWCPSAAPSTDPVWLWVARTTRPRFILAHRPDQLLCRTRLITIISQESRTLITDSQSSMVLTTSAKRSGVLEIRPETLDPAISAFFSVALNYAPRTLKRQKVERKKPLPPCSLSQTPSHIVYCFPYLNFAS